MELDSAAPEPPMLPAISFWIRPFCLLAVLVSPQLRAQTDADAGAAQLQLSADGSEVQDLRARLAWSRCLQGMEWRQQRCEGSPQRLNYAQAQKLAKSRNQVDGLRWRLPRANELRRLRQSATPVAGQAPLLPDVPGDWHWTGTAAVNAGAVNQYTYDQTGPVRNRLSGQQAWAVDWATGQASGEMGRGNLLLVRWVRSLGAP